MKKVLLLLLIFSFILPLVACGAGSPSTGSTAANLEATGTTGATKPSSSVTEPADPTEPEPTEPTQPTEPEPTDPPGPVKPEVPAAPTAPADLITEQRTEAPVYIPDLFNPTGGYGPPDIFFDLPQECFPGMEITFDLKADYVFLGGSNRSDSVKALANGKGLSISWFNWDEMKAVVDAGGSTFIEVIIRADGYIVGYGIYEIGTDGNYYASMRTESVIFPVIDGVLQYSTEEYVAEKIAELKQIITPLDIEAKYAEEEAYWTAYRENYWNNFYAERTPVESDAIHVTASVDLFSEYPEIAEGTVIHLLDGKYPTATCESTPPYPMNEYAYGSETQPHIQIYPHISYGLGVNDGQLTYEYRTNYSGFFDKDLFLGDECVLDSSAYWKGVFDLPEDAQANREKPEHIWVDVIIRSRDHIVGFAVFEIVPLEDVNEGYTVNYHYSEVYDFVDGRFQSVPLAFVTARIEACHRIFDEQ